MGLSTRGTGIEGITTAVDLVDNNNSDSDNKSETPSLVDLDLSDDKDSDGDDDDDANSDKNVINYVFVSENENSDRQERVNQNDKEVIDHISVLENTHFCRQETVNPETNTNMTTEGRTKALSTSTAGITSTAVEQLARGHIFDDKEDGAQHVRPRSQRIMNQTTLTKSTLKILSTLTWIT